MNVSQTTGVFENEVRLGFSVDQKRKSQDTQGVCLRVWFVLEWFSLRVNIGSQQRDQPLPAQRFGRPLKFEICV